MRISIVTVTYNSAKTVEDTLASVLKQQYKDYEYIVIDGGSTDETVDIIKVYEGKFTELIAECQQNSGAIPSFRWISERDEGMYDGINKGIRMATGDVVGIINSDDFYHRADIFDVIVKAFEDNPESQAIYGDVRFVNPDNLEKTVRYYSSKNFKPYKFRWGWMPAHPSFFTYKENFEKYGYYQYDYHIAADYELLTRFLYTNKLPAICVPVDFLRMRMGGRSTDGIQANVRLNKEIVRACKENGIYTNMPMLFLKYFVKIFELIKTRN